MRTGVLDQAIVHELHGLVRLEAPPARGPQHPQRADSDDQVGGEDQRREAHVGREGGDGDLPRLSAIDRQRGESERYVLAQATGPKSEDSSAAISA